MNTITINNVSEWGKTQPYVVAREVDGKWWFWGGYDTHERALEVAVEVGGQVFSTADKSVVMVTPCTPKPAEEPAKEPVNELFVREAMLYFKGTGTKAEVLEKLMKACDEVGIELCVEEKNTYLRNEDGEDIE